MPEADLTSFAFFKGMKPEHVQLLSKQVAHETYKANEFIFREKEEASKMFLVVKGKVSIEVSSTEGKPFSIQHLKAGEILGWSWLFPPHEWRFSARATEPTELLILDGDRLRDMSEMNHDFGYELFKRLANVFVHRLEATRHQLIEMYNTV